MQLKLYHTHVLSFLYLAVQSGIALATSDDATVVSTVVITSYAPQPTPAQSYTSETLFEDTVLNVTNRYRAQHDASALTWNNSLTAYAENWAKKCLWKHSHGPYGENLAEGYPNASASVEAWGDEEKLYNYSDPGYAESTGHFTQLVWRASRTVGCARVNCTSDTGGDDGKASGWFVVCEYYPAGNVVGDDNKYFIENVLPVGGGSNSSNSTDSGHKSGAVGRVQGIKVSGVWAVEISLGLVMMSLNGFI
ncbi:hypothetical protein DTO217A2_4815 [Paecilomyces variotii]|nr:hypothetical protein DTO217A2_4815 [Paecilomyces variotii]